METRKLIELLRATIDPNQQKQAEDHLNQVHKIIGFAPSLLQALMLNDVEMPVRQAGGIYLKNLINQSWQERECDSGQPMPFSIHEQDRAMIRDAIVDAVVHAPDLIRVQLGLCVSTIIKHDFPARWTGIVDKVSIYLQNPDTACWMGALVCLYQLVKNYEYKKPEERGPLSEAMNLLLPLMQQRGEHLLSDQSEFAVTLLKQVLKVYFAMVQYSLPLDLITKETFQRWMEIITTVADRPIPELTIQVDEDERQELVWWKCKKWAVHILTRIFERYGSPGYVGQEYKEFSEWYLKNFSAGVIAVLLKVLDHYRHGIYVSPRVLQLTLNYLNQAVNHAFTWKFLKMHMEAVVREVLFPIMCYTEQDAQMWVNDPHEYIRLKFGEKFGVDIFEDILSPVTAAQTLLHSAVKKRKDMLLKTMSFVMGILNNPTPDLRQKDGALHMIGTLADILLKKQFYKEQLEVMLVTHVYPEFNSSEGYMRARACWTLHHFSDIRFQNEQNLLQASHFTQRCLLTDKDLPVKVEAAVALQMLISNQDKAQRDLKTNVKPIAFELLKIIRETENDDLTNVMQKLVCTYTEELTPIAVEMTQHLATTFSQVLDSEEGSDEKAITAMGLLNTIETILTVMEQYKDVMIQLEAIVNNVVGLILTQSVMEFYDEALSLVYSLTCKNISAAMWQVFDMLFKMFVKDGFEYFTDMMPALHNYITVDTAAFLSDEKNLFAIYNMCKAVLTSSDAGEDPECHAAKLLEVVLLQCKGSANQCVPSFVELVLERLTREVKTSELRTMCLQVVIAALYCDPQFLLGTLDKMRLPNQTEAITSQFIKQWIHDTDCFLGLHDRKLCVLGLCTLLNMPSGGHTAVNEVASQLIPSLILLFDGLKRAYANRALIEEESEEDDEEYDPEVLASDEDDVDDEGDEYLEHLTEKVQTANSPFPVRASLQEDEDDDDDAEDTEETALESYQTPLDMEDCLVDEYVIFKEIIQRIQLSDPSWHAMLTAHLTPEQQKNMQEVFLLADQRKAAAESKQIEKRGGYVFQNQTVPSSFNFGGSFNS
uniref:Importin N-terminal domain-containing protein n=1 Tax=Strigamia maritima TaxID=126957 RepID=T1J129_STRMM